MEETVAETTLEEETLQVRRRHAEFHRRLGELLSELVTTAEVYWVGALLNAQFDDVAPYTDTACGHELHDDARHNIYRKAVYVVPTLAPYRAALARLAELRETLAGAGTVLEPVAVDDVVSLRLPAHVFHRHYRRDVTAAEAEWLSRLGAARRYMEACAEHGYDATYRAAHQRVGELEQDLAALVAFRQAGGGPLLKRVRLHRVLASVRRAGARARQYPIRDAGLVVAGFDLVVSVPTAPPKVRNDRLEEVVAPLAQAENVAWYDAEKWTAASPRAQSGQAPNEL